MSCLSKSVQISGSIKEPSRWMTLLSSAYLIDHASAAVSASMALDLKKLFCFPQSGFHKSQRFFVFLLGILLKDFLLRCTKGNRKFDCIDTFLLPSHIF